MVELDFHPSGRHFLQIPGPSPVPDRILRAMSLPTIDHRGPEFGALGRKVLAGMQTIFKTRHPVIIYPASGTGAWEAALVGLAVELVKGFGEDVALPNAPGWRRGVQADLIEQRLLADKGHHIKSV